MFLGRQIESKVARLDYDQYNAENHIRQVEEDNNRLARKYAGLKEQVGILVENQKRAQHHFVGKDKEVVIGRMERDMEELEHKLSSMQLQVSIIYFFFYYYLFISSFHLLFHLICLF